MIKINQVIDSTIFEFKRFKNSDVRSLEEAVKTLRKLPLFGLQNQLINFEYPFAANLLAMPKDKQITVEKFVYLRDSVESGI